MKRSQFILIYENDNYGPLIDSYSKSIFKSALLLDEDLEVFLREYSFKTVPEPQKYRPSFGLTASLGSILFSLIISRRYSSILYTIPSLALTAKFAYTELQTVQKKKKQARLMNDLIETIRANHSLNGSMVRYMKTRAELGKKSDQLFFTAFNRSTQEFMKILSKSEYNFFQVAMDNLSRIASFSDDLMEDYICLKEFNSDSIIKDSEVGDINDCLNFTKMIQDVHIWLLSKILSYIGIIFCSRKSKLDAENFELFINVRLPHLLMCLKHHHAYLKKQFASLRDSVNRLSQHRTNNAITSVKNVSNKLRDSLVYSINNISIILEKSHGLLETIEQGETNSFIIDKGLLDLKDHTRATYESLDLLCRLYGIMNNTNNKQDKIEQPPQKPPDNMAVDAETHIINCDDEIEALTEQYELYLDKDEKEEINNQVERRCQDDSGAYLSLMLRELKQSLKKHERFIEAKKRRGSSAGADDEEKVEQKPESPPKFDLEVLKENGHPTNNIEVTEENKSSVLGDKLQDCEIKMPPPPPLPSFDLSDMQNGEHISSNNKTMLENVIALSKQTNNKEDVFIISESDSDCKQ